MPDLEAVYDYFIWRYVDADRNALNNYAYWVLRIHEGLSKRKATSMLVGKDKKFKKELLQSYNINYDELPLWQRFGTAVYFTGEKKTGYNPITDEAVKTRRNVLKYDHDLPDKANEYRSYLENIIAEF